ncbi:MULTISPECIES: S1 RNA-binding domain-containing protein [Amycolatopsis]|uniref:S1 RNA binding domain-containing protein n=2 Tax=Amycolatopsis TaxID=1813 RepID=A0A1I3ZJQ0_9PSEU|nr:S1 RNA-binding domain-containing protein [Amycolatopsis sacchari]SFK43779.1 S1 RNA binding domain-containing protein [Amycolatopsis sacchari]
MSQSTTWHEFVANSSEGGAVEATVTKVLPFGALLEVAPGVHGLLPSDEWPAEPAPGSTVRVRVAEIDVLRRRMRFAAA